jgi:hypothetical protein
VVTLDEFVEPSAADANVRDTTYSEKHCRDLKSAIGATGLESPIYAERVTDENGNTKLLIVEGNHRFKAISELFEDDPNWGDSLTGEPEIKVYVLEEGFFPSPEHCSSFQIYMNRPVLKKSCTPDEVIRVTGEMISADMFGNVATSPQGAVEERAKAFVKDLYPTMSRRQVADAITARANKARNKRRLTHGYTANDARNFKAASRTVFDGTDRKDYILSPMVISNDNADFRKALGEVYEKLGDLDASGGAGVLTVKTRMVAKTNKSTDTDIDTVRAKIRAKVAAVNAYANSTMLGTDIVDEVIFLPEKSTEGKERRLKRFV